VQAPTKYELVINSLQFLDCAEQIDQRAADAVDRPSHHNVKAAFLGVIEHLIEARALIPALGAANTRIAVSLDLSFPKIISGRIVD
jgi:hypothetical protein